MKKIEKLNQEKKDFKEDIKLFFQDKDLNKFFQQVYQEKELSFSEINYLFQITNRNSLLKRNKEMINKHSSYSISLLDVLFYLDLKFSKNLIFKEKVDNSFLRNQNQPVLLILDFKNREELDFKKGLENFEILLKTNFNFFNKNNVLIIDSSLKFKDFFKFLKEKNKNFNFDKLVYFKKVARN